MIVNSEERVLNHLITRLSVLEIKNLLGEGDFYCNPSYVSIPLELQTFKYVQFKRFFFLECANTQGKYSQESDVGISSFRWL